MLICFHTNVLKIILLKCVCFFFYYIISKYLNIVMNIVIIGHAIELARKYTIDFTRAKSLHQNNLMKHFRNTSYTL